MPVLEALIRLFRPDPSDTPDPRQKTRGLATIILPRSTLDNRVEHPEATVEAVVEFVRVMQTRGLYLRQELPPQALQAAHCALYAREVRKGGHERFLGARPSDKAVLDDINTALVSMEAGGFAAIFEGLRTWMALDAEAGDGQTSADGAPALAELDALFREMNEARPLIDIIARWIEGLPNLQVVDDETIGHLFTHTARLNPQRGARMAARTLETIEGMLGDPLAVGAGMAVLAVDPDAPALSMELPGRDVSGASSLHLIQVRTAAGALQVVSGPDSVAVHESGADTLEEQADPGSVVDAPMATLARSEIDKACAAVMALDAATAVALLLRKANADGALGFVSVAGTTSADDGAEALGLWAVADGRVFRVLATQERAVLSDDESGTRIEEATRAEIAAYAAQIAAVI